MRNCNKGLEGLWNRGFSDKVNWEFRNENVERKKIKVLVIIKMNLLESVAYVVKPCGMSKLAGNLLEICIEFIE